MNHANFLIVSDSPIGLAMENQLKKAIEFPPDQTITGPETSIRATVINIV